MGDSIQRAQDVRRVLRRFRREGLTEEQVVAELLPGLVKDLPRNVRGIWEYGLMEMINNAISHSGGSSVVVGVRRTPSAMEGVIADDGEGIFLRIQRELELFDPRLAILELVKGKFTSDPVHHTGEGVFFTSKIFDEFQIRSGRLRFVHDHGERDVLFESARHFAGTLVRMRLRNDSTRTALEVFNEFTESEEHRFTKTIVPVRLAQLEGTSLMSRSQARRLTRRFECFETVILDFEGVEEIGQGFADETFRVFQNANRSTRLLPVHMTPDVEFMVRRAGGDRRDGQGDRHDEESQLARREAGSLPFPATTFAFKGTPPWPRPQPSGSSTSAHRSV